MPNPIAVADALLDQFESFICHLNQSDKDLNTTIAEIEAKKATLPEHQNNILDFVVFNFLWIEPEPRKAARMRGELDEYFSNGFTPQRLGSGDGK